MPRDAALSSHSAQTAVTTRHSWWSSPYLLLTLTSLFWSLNWVVGRAMVGQVPPVALAYWRWVLAVLFMLPFAIPQICRSWRVIWKHRGILVLLGLIGTGFHNLISYVGLNYTTATNGVLLNSSIPVMIILLGALFFGQRISARQVAGVAISLCGVFAILSKGHPATLATFRFNIGDLIVLSSMLLWALYTLALKWRPAEIPPIAFLWVCGVAGLAGMTPVYVWELSTGAAIHWSPQVASAFCYLGLFPSFIGYIFWNKGVVQVGPNVSEMFVHLMPVFGSVLAWLFLDERLYWFHFAGMSLILTGIFLSTRSSKQVLLPAGEE
jgi:drug/metabolite transporter (DMT)-like permease